MRFSLICSVLATGAMAIPGHLFPNSATTNSLSTSTPTVSVDRVSTSTGSSGPLSTGETKEQIYLDKWAKFIAELYSSHHAKNASSKEAEKTSFMEKYYNVSKITYCYYDISSNASCEANVVQPAIKYTRMGIEYSRAYYKKLGPKVANFYKKSRAQAEGFLSDFTHYDVAAVNRTGSLEIAQSLAKNLTHLSSGSSHSGMSLRSAAMTFGSGILSAAQPAVTKIFKSMIGSGKIDNISVDSLRDAFGNVTNILRKSAMSGLGASAVNIAWAMDDVFIAKTSSDIGDQKASDMKLSLLGDHARTCDKKGTCYFFVVAQNVSNIADKKWKAVKGLNKVEKYNITLLEFARSADWFHHQFSGMTYPNSSALLESLKSNDTRPAFSYFVNLPVVEYESSKVGSSSKNSSEEAFLRGLSRQVSTVKGWPYSKKGSQ